MGRLGPKTWTAIAATAVGAAAFAAPPAAAASIEAYPGLYPAFSRTVHDYVSRCGRGRSLILAVHVPGATRVRLGERAPRAGSVRRRLHLAAGQRVTVRIGSARYRVRCLPRAFPKWTAERDGRPQARWYLVTPAEGGKKVSRYVALFDRNGVPVWWKRAHDKPIDAKVLPDGNLAWSYYTDTPFAAYSVPYEEYRPDGGLVRTIAAVGIETDSHDLQVLPNGDYLLVGYVPRDGVDLSAYGGPSDATVTDAEVQEVSPHGELVFSWNSKDHVALAESEPFMGSVLAQPAHLADGRTAYDIAHVNSVEPDGDALLISLRHTDSVYKVARGGGAIEWKLGGTRTGDSLAVAGEPDGSLLFSGQHDARLDPDGTLTVHDNRTGTELGPRAVRFRIDEAQRTATTVEELTDPDAVLSLCCGSARRLPGGDWVMSWGYNSLVTELSATGERRFALRFRGGYFSYRAVPVRSGELSARALRAGMDAMHPDRSG